ncbi:MAG: neutral/alkaline non-lysosomal ceramidase N-terminal domain-containing protein [Candidatus Latescibacterota bacterium]
MRAGFGQHRITPPVGVELCGFGFFRRRRSDGVYEPLYAKAMAVEAGGREVLIVACDLIGVTRSLADQVRISVSEDTGVPIEAIMICCTHTHSGPATVDLMGLGEPDHRYLARLPGKIAQAARTAHEKLTEAEMAVATIAVPIAAFCYNRVYGGERDGTATGEPLDREAEVLKFTSGGNLLGMVSFHSVHPVVCCEETFKLHGDFVGVASNTVARENGEAVALFLQGACGDINPIYCHKPEEASLVNLEKLAALYAHILRQGLIEAQPVPVDSVGATRRFIPLQLQIPDREDLERKIDRARQTLGKEHLSAQEEQRATFELYAGTAVLGKLNRGDPPEMIVELQAIRIGEQVFIGHPFELFNAIKKKVEQAVRPGKVFVVGYVNDYKGYAPTADRYALGENDGRERCYAAHGVPFIRGDFPFDPTLEATLVREMIGLHDQVSNRPQKMHPK